MRKGLKHITTLLCGASLIGAGFTAGAETQIDFDMTTGQLEIFGEIEDGKSAYATFSIFAADVNPASLTESSPELDNAIYKTVKLSGDGSFKETMVIPSGFETGEYALRTYGSDLEGINYFAFVPGAVSKSDLSGINNAENAPEVLKAMKELTKIYFDSASLTAYGKAVSEYIYSLKPSGGYDAESLIAAYYNGLALARIEQGDISAQEGLLQYSAYSSIDYDKEYAPLTAAEKQTLEALFTSSHGVNGDFGEIYGNLSMTAKMINASSFEDLQEKYLAYAVDNGISLKDYNDLSTDYSRDKVFMSVYSSVDEVKNMEDITALFEEAVEDEEDSGSSGGSGGGGGSSGSRGSSGVSGGNATYIPVEAPVTESIFTDTKGHWAENEITALKNSGAISGFPDGSFRPDSTVTRAEFVKMLGNILDIPDGSGSQFADVTADDWYAGVVYGAYARNLVKGTSDTSFSPNAPITRQDAAVIISRAWDLAGEQAVEFADSGDIADYAVEAVAKLAAAGIIGGYEDNTIRPGANLTRAETATILCRVITAE
ncbi:MAG: S-layer homology domain-containing protein [Clostridia bacterium]|nr:S-layer homology domain-containing protein [Clostridia bacterium]